MGAKTFVQIQTTAGKRFLIGRMDGRQFIPSTQGKEFKTSRAARAAITPKKRRKMKSKRRK